MQESTATHARNVNVLPQQSSTLSLCVCTTNCANILHDCKKKRGGLGDPFSIPLTHEKRHREDVCCLTNMMVGWGDKVIENVTNNVSTMITESITHSRGGHDHLSFNLSSLNRTTHNLTRFLCALAPQTPNRQNTTQQPTFRKGSKQPPEPPRLHTRRERAGASATALFVTSHHHHNIQPPHTPSSCCSLRRRHTTR